MDKTGYAPVINLEALKCATEECRIQLERDPADMESRVQLAWCLFLLAMLGASIANGSPETPGKISLSTRDSEKALTDCLRETFTVMQLSTDRRDHIRVTTLQSLVKLLCGAQALSKAEKDAASVLTGLIREMFIEDTETNLPIS